jgi:hypothetical protein
VSCSNRRTGAISIDVDGNWTKKTRDPICPSCIAILDCACALSQEAEGPIGRQSVLPHPKRNSVQGRHSLSSASTSPPIHPLVFAKEFAKAKGGKSSLDGENIPRVCETLRRACSLSIFPFNGQDRIPVSFAFYVTYVVSHSPKGNSVIATKINSITSRALTGEHSRRSSC